MKRSEMVSIICKAIEEYSGNEFPISEDEGNHILNRIEQAKMLPPFSHTEYHKEWTKYRDSRSVTGNKWDLEDENS